MTENGGRQNLLLAGAVELNALVQGALRRYAPWPRVELPTFPLRSRLPNNELLLSLNTNFISFQITPNMNILLLVL